MIGQVDMLFRIALMIVKLLVRYFRFFTPPCVTPSLRPQRGSRTSLSDRESLRFALFRAGRRNEIRKTPALEYRGLIIGEA